jgi:hypothetical protein
MDDFTGRHAYRCLPMAIANAYGWDVLAPCDFEIEWFGGLAQSDITFRALDGYPFLPHFAQSNFARGVVTFHTGYIFRTNPGWHLVATGPFNSPRRGWSPLTGIVETDWLPYPFTMNWQLTEPGTLRVEKGEPFCRIFPVVAGNLESVTPELYSIEQDPELKQQHDTWRQSRDEFRGRLAVSDPNALKQAWQKYYFKGEQPDSGAKVPSHTPKLRLASPVDKRQP